MRKYKRTAQQRPQPAFSPILNTTQADRDAYEHYAKWCRGIGIMPAAMSLYLRANPRTEAHCNNIDLILMAHA